MPNIYHHTGTNWFNFVGYDDLVYLRSRAHMDMLEADMANGWADELAIIIGHLDDQFREGDGIGFFPNNRYQMQFDRLNGIVRKP